MFGFGNRQAASDPPLAVALRAEVVTLRGEVARLSAEVATMAAENRTLKGEWSDASDRMYRLTKRYEAAARRVDGPAVADPVIPSIPADTPLRAVPNTSVRMRRLIRAQAARANGASEEGE